MPSVLLADLPGHRLEPACKSASLAVLPLGSIEYHGPHGPVGTDLHLAEDLARRVAEPLNALVLPALAYSHCPPATRTYGGTISVSEETLARYLEDVLAGVFELKVPGVLALNAHDGNIRPLQTAADRLALRYQRQFLLLVNWWETLPKTLTDALGYFTQDGGHGHGGPLEMAAADAARPNTVDWNAARDLDVIFPPGQGVVRALMEGRPLPNWDGYHGRTTEGSPQKGETLLTMASARIVELTNAWLVELAHESL